MHNNDKKSLDKTELEEFGLLDDVVKWAYVYLGWEAFDYQIPILQDIKKRQQSVLRLGRRLGKCLTGDTKIIDPYSGEVYELELLYRKTGKD